MTDFDPNDRGEYPIGPEPAPNLPAPGRPLIRVNTSMMGRDLASGIQPIPYARVIPAEEPQPSIPTGLQFLLGSISPFVCGAVCAIISATSGAGSAVAWLGLFGFIGLTAFVHVRLRWKGFIPGVLTTILALPLIVFAICGVILLGIGGAGGFR